MEQLYLYLITNDNEFEELDEDDGTVDNCNIKDGDRLYLLSYKWAQNNLKVTVKKTGRELYGLEEDDTCFVIKVKAQDQTAAPVSTIKLARLVEYEWREDCKWYVSYKYEHKYK